MKKLIPFVLNTKIFISFAVLCLGLTTQLYLKSYNVNLLFVLFFGTLISYNFQRIIFFFHNSRGVKSSWFFSNTKLTYFLLFFSVIAFIYFFLKLNSTTKLMIALLSIISFSYPFGLRNIPFLKIFLITFSWAFSTTSLIYFENQILIDMEFYLLFFSRAFFIIALTIPFDIRDAKYDLQKIITIPIFFGLKVSKYISISFLFAYLLIELFLFSFFNFSLSLLLTSILGFGYTIFFILQVNENKSEFYYSFWLESCSVSLLFFLIITSIFL